MEHMISRLFQGQGQIDNMKSTGFALVTENCIELIYALKNYDTTIQAVYTYTLS